MYRPNPGDYIDIHVHGGKPESGIFLLESLMAHEGKWPGDTPGVAYTFGIHPWFLDEENHAEQIAIVRSTVCRPDIIAIGEAGFDRLKGPSTELQRLVFEEQVMLSEKTCKPLIIHCVKGWDDMLSVKKRLKPRMPWLVHGFRGTVELASQLLAKGIYLSVWFDFALRPESGNLLRNIPSDRIFLETDGADADIRSIYKKVAGDLNINTNELIAIIMDNYINFFRQHT